jgi:hypothetical protein
VSRAKSDAKDGVDFGIIVSMMITYYATFGCFVGQREASPPLHTPGRAGTGAFHAR